MELKVRGGAFLATKQFLLEKLGEKEYGEKIKEFSPEIKSFLKSNIIENLFYPYELFAKLNKDIVEKIFKGDKKRLRDIGKYSIRRAANGSFREVYMKTDLKTYVYNLGSFTFNYFYKFGKFKVMKFDSEKKEIIVHIFNIPFTDELFEERIAGALYAAAEIRNFKNIKVNITKRVSKGDKLCEYVITWK